MAHSVVACLYCMPALNCSCWMWEVLTCGVPIWCLQTCATFPL